MPLTNIITATVTAYCACKVCCGPNAKGICADTKKPVQGITIAVPRKIPLGAKVIVTSAKLHTYTAQDRTAKRYDGRFDIFFNSHQKAKQFGIKTNQTIIIIQP